MVAPDIKRMRLTRGMTQEQVGILSGMSKSQISRMESGKLGSPDTFARVLDALGYRSVVTYVDERWMRLAIVPWSLMWTSVPV